jgi:transcriptional regulator with XRE-family HTH domain
VNSLEILSSNLRNARLRLGFTQEMLAERAGVTYRHYQDIEAGRKPGLRVATVDRLAAALGETTSRLLEAGRHSQPEARRGRNPRRIQR